MNDQEIFTHPDHPGLRFRVSIEGDYDHEAPWESESGHGPVRQALVANKRPGERVLHKEWSTGWLYDWQAATKIAKRDGWGGDDPVQADFDRLRGWLTERWYYVGVCVEVIDENDRPLTDKYEHALWGIESDCDDFIEETAHELAEQAGKAYAEVQGLERKVRQAEQDTLADAMRWRKLCLIVKNKELGTEFDEYGKPHSPTFRRWFIDTTDVAADSLAAALDSMKEPQA